MTDKDQNQISEEYTQVIKKSIDSGDFFRESIKWYVFQYIRPIVDRNNMVLFSIVGFFTVYLLYEMINDSFPLVEEFPVVIKEKDTSLYNPIIKKLKNNDEDSKLSADMVVLKILITKYIEEREGFDFSKSDIQKVNQKYNIIKNNSSFLEYKNFQQKMDKSNPNSPLRFFGKNIKRKIKIESFKPIEKKRNSNFFIQFFTTEVPNEAEVVFTAEIETQDVENNIKKTQNKFLVKIRYDYEEIDRDNKEAREIGFIVKKYELFDIR